MIAANLKSFDGVEADNELVLEAVTKAVEFAASLTALAPPLPSGLDELGARAGIRAAMATALGAVNSLLAVTNARCTIDQPPADLEITSDDGILIYRCQHPVRHKWKLDGTPL